MADRRWGLTLPLPGISLPEHEGHVRRAEAAGYTDLWTDETNGADRADVHGAGALLATVSPRPKADR